QDELAARSHHRAAAAIASGRFAAEIVPVEVGRGDGARWVHTDTLVRADTSVEKLARLEPAFAHDGAGTLTAGHSSALTDGASAARRPWAPSIRSASTCTEARSRSGTPSPPRASAWSRRWPTSCTWAGGGPRCWACAPREGSGPRPSSRTTPPSGRY